MFVSQDELCGNQDNHFFDEGIAYCQKQQFEKAYQCFKKHLAQNSFCQKTFHMLSYCCYKFSEIHRNNVNDISVITKHPKSCKGINKVPKNESSALSLNLRSSKIQDKCTFFNDDLENLNPTKYKGQKKLIKNFRNLRPSKKNQKSFQYESEPPLIISPCVNESHKVRKSSSSNSISVGSCRNNHSSTKSILKQMADHQLKIELFLSKIDRTLSNIELEVNHLLTKERKFNSKVSNLLHLVSHGDSFFETKTDEMQKNSKAVSKKNVVTLYQPSQFATELAYWPFPYWYGENFVNSVLGDSTAQVNLCSPYFGNKNVHEERGSAENIVQIADCSSWPKQETDALVEYCLQATPKDETDALVESYVQATPKEETDALVESYVQATLNQETNALVESYEQALISLLSENDCSQPQKLSKGKLGCDAPLVTLTPSFKRKLDFSETYIHCLPRKKLQLSTLLNRAIAKRKLISAEKTVDSKRQKIQSSNQSFGRPSLLSRGVALKMYKELQLLRDLSIGVVSTGCGNILGKSSRERQFIGASHKTIMKIINPSFQCIKSAPVQMKPTISCSLEYLAELSLDLCSSSSVVSLPNSGSILPRPKRRVLKGEISATAFGPPCPQYDTRRGDIIGSEDCLFLNVFTPKNHGDELYPVIFWIHGGGFMSGSAAQYDPVSLVQKKLIVVTTQYRLGSLGFLGDSSRDLPGNAGLFDVIAALHWTRMYIERFGGDPNRIVASGHGSGASVASFLGLSEFSKEYISGIFAMSGTPISSFAVDEEPAAFSNNITQLNGCDTARSNLAMVKCMQNLPLKDIISNDYVNLEGRLTSDGFVTLLGKSLNPSAVVEGENDYWFLPFFLNKQPLEALQAGMYAMVPMLTGVTLHETSTAIKGGFKDKVLQALKDVPQYLERALPTSLLITNTGLLTNGTLNSLIGALFQKLDYLKLLTVSAPKLPAIDKVVQMTTDALFNLPVFLMSNLRAQRANTFLYSFEHVSRLGKAAAKEFLPNSPITKGDQNDAASVYEVGDGEDLVHLFDVRSVEGKEIEMPRLEEEEDLKTRELFSTVVAEFAYHGKPLLKSSNIDWTPFSTEKSEYLAIKAKPELRNDFHFCEMGLWTGILDRLQSPKCNFPNIKNILTTIPANLWGNSLTNTIWNVGDTLNPGESIPVVGGVLSGNTNSAVGGVLTGNPNSVTGLLGLGSKEPIKQSTTTKKPRPTTTVPKPSGGLLGLGGLLG